MKEVKIENIKLKQAAKKGMDDFLAAFVDAIYATIGGELTVKTMSELSTDQLTLLAYSILRDEVMDGGFIQLIHNGYGGFIFRNPFGKMIRNWGLVDLYKLVNKTHKLYNKFHTEIERDCTDDEFMAMFERFAEFDHCDDTFVENEEKWTATVARYVDEHIGNFAQIV